MDKKARNLPVPVKLNDNCFVFCFIFILFLFLLVASFSLFLKKNYFLRLFGTIVL